MPEALLIAAATATRVAAVIAAAEFVLRVARRVSCKRKRR